MKDKVQNELRGLLAGAEAQLRRETAAAHEKIAQTLAADIIGRLNLKKPEAKP